MIGPVALIQTSTVFDERGLLPRRCACRLCTLADERSGVRRPFAPGDSWIPAEVSAGIERPVSTTDREFSEYPSERGVYIDAHEPSSMDVDAIDHLVLYAEDIPATVAFYERVGASVETFAGGRTALRFGNCKINLHPADEPYELHAAAPESGTADFCLVVTTPIDEVVAQLNVAGIDIIEGPVEKHGACGPMTSVYVRDPDGNLVEFATYHA